MSLLEERLRRQGPRRDPGQEIEAGGNAPFSLDAAGMGGPACLLLEGTVELFAAPRREDGTWGPRTHLATATAGQMLFGSPAPPEGSAGLCFLAVGRHGARLLRLSAEDLARLAADPELAVELAAHLDGWVTRLLGGLQLPPAPKVFQEVRPGAEVELPEEGGAVRPREGVVWVRGDATPLHFLGNPTLPVPPDLWLPLPESAWLVAPAAARLSCQDATGLLLEGGAAGPGLLGLLGLLDFHGLILACVHLQIEKATQAERDRLERKTGLDRLALQGAYSRLASVLVPEAPREVAPAEADDPLLAACRLVGAAQGFEVRRPPEMRGGLKQGDRLATICSASRVRSRRAILRGEWWRQDGGPLLAFRVLDAGNAENPERKENRPVALLPTSARSYALVDPVERTRVPVDAAVAESLSGDAYLFYSPLPERPLGKKDLFQATFRGRKDDLWTLVLMGMAGGLLGLLLPVLTGQIFGTAIPAADRSRLWQMAAALIVSAFAAAAFQITRSIAVLRLGGKFDGTVQAAVWDRLLALPAGFFRRFTVGDLATRSMGIDAIREITTGNVVTSILSAAFSVFSFGLLFYYSPRLAWVATALVAVLMGTTLLLTWLQLRHQRELYEFQGKVASLLFGLIAGIGKLRVSGAERRAFALWAERFADQRRRTFQAQRVANVQATFNAVYGVLTSMALFAFMGFYFLAEGKLTEEEGLTLGEFLAFNAAFGQFLAAALAMVGVFSSVLAMVPLYERLSPILLEPPEVDASKPDAGELAGAIELSHVSFRYQPDGPLILDDVSIRARPGEFIALVGPSGSGKSTCLRLILGFEKPSAGSLYFDGQDLFSLDIPSVRRQIGVVLQTGRPLVGSIFSNIVGGANLSMDDAWEAARMAGLAEDVQAMPMGMHTVISEGADTFSGGQKQRLLIARALVRRPRILLFDEATSALDNRTQEIVSQSLERLKATRIVIAHRLSTIQHADRIYVGEGGRVVEEGTYDELARRGGPFSRLVERQLA